MTTFRELHQPGQPFILANAWDAGSARVLAGLGAEAIGTTSAGHAFTLGLPDGGHVTRDQLLVHGRELVAATTLPVSADMENGYGHEPADVAESVRLAARAGLAGCSIEDTAWPAADPYPADRATARIAAAVDAARALDDDFVLVARADGVMNGKYDLDEGIERVKAFADVGADCVYVPLLRDLGEVERVCSSVEVPVNVLTVGALTAYSRQQFADAGVARLSLGSALARITHKALVDAATTVIGGGDFGPLAGGASGKAIDDLLTRS